MEYQHVKIEIFLPESYLPDLCTLLQKLDAGHIGRYDSCLSYSRTRGRWRPLEGAHPFIGKEGCVSEEEEVKVEVVCQASRFRDVVAAVRLAHPYEEPVINVLPLIATGLDFV